MVSYVAERLQELRDEFVFLGGAIVGLLLDQPGARIPRATRDVDATVQASTLSEFYALDRALLAKGFVNDVNGPLCRYLHGSVRLDVMPLNEEVLGFSNRWYRLAFETAVRQTLPGGLMINLVSAPCFLATKLEAFQQPEREGAGDVFASRDFADLVSVLDGRSSIFEEIVAAPAELRGFLVESFDRIRSSRYLEEAIAEHVDPGREERVVLLLNAITSNTSN
jgi:hypothetical protein